MGHENYARAEAESRGSDRSFGLVFTAVFATVGVLPLLRGHPPRLWALVLAAVLLAISLKRSPWLAPMNRAWAWFGLQLHRLVNPVVLGVMFFLVVAPTGMLMRALGKDPLRLRFEESAPSYWIPRTPPGPAPESLKDQF